MENNWQTSKTDRTKDIILKNNLQLKWGISAKSHTGWLVLPVPMARCCSASCHFQGCLFNEVVFFLIYVYSRTNFRGLGGVRFITLS